MIDKGISNDSLSLKFIETKGAIFNRIVCLKIDEFLSYIPQKTRFRISIAEIWLNRDEFSEMISSKKLKKAKCIKRKADEVKINKEELWNTIDSENLDLLTHTNKSYITIRIPISEPQNIQISEEHKNKIDYFVYVDQPFSENYDNNNNKWICLKDIPKIKKISDFRKRSLTKSFMSEEIKKIIVDKKNAALKKFEEEIMKSVNEFAKLTQDQIEEMKKIQNEDINNFAFIKNYPWFSCSDVIKLWKITQEINLKLSCESTNYFISQSIRVKRK